MKIGIKRVARTIALVLALCATGGAWAAVKPLVVWNGDFPTSNDGTSTRNGYRLSVKGNTAAADGSKITLKSSNNLGVEVVHVDANGNMAVAKTPFAAVYNIYNITTGGSRMFGTSIAYNGSTPYYNRTMAGLSGTTFKSWHSGGSGGSEQLSKTFSGNSTTKYSIGFLYRPSGSTGTDLYLDGDHVMEADGIKSSSDANNVYGVALGGCAGSETRWNFPNAEISYVAILNSADEADIAAWSLNGLTASATFTDGGTISSETSYSTTGVNLNGGTITVSGAVTAAAIFVQADTVLNMVAGTDMLASTGPVYIADGVTLTINVTGNPSEYVAGTGIEADLITGTLYVSDTIIEAGTLAAVSGGRAGIETDTANNTIKWVYKPMPVWNDGAWVGGNEPDEDTTEITINSTTSAEFAPVGEYETVYVQGSSSLSVSGTLTVGTLNVAAGSTVNMANITATTVTGEGTVIYDGIAPVATDAAWRGTVWIKNYAFTGINLNAYGNEHSLIKLTSTSGTLANGLTCAAPVELVDDGDTPALNLAYPTNPGILTYTFSELRGTGALETSGPGWPEVTHRVLKWDNFAGKLSIDRGRFVFGAGDFSAAQYRNICVSANASVEVASGKTWHSSTGYVIDAGATLTVTGEISYGGASNDDVKNAVSGSGTVVFSGKAPSPTGGKWWTTSGWTGTVWIKNLSVTNFDGNLYGNANSTLKLSGVSGYFPTSSDCLVPIELSNSGYNYGLYVTDGFSRSTTHTDYVNVIRELKGDGEMWTGNNGDNVWFNVRKWSGFTGKIQLVNKIVVFGDDVPALEDFNTAGSIYVRQGKTVQIASGKQWRADGGIYLEGELQAEGVTETSFRTGTDIITYDTGIFTLTSTGNGTEAETDTDYAHITGTGSLKYEGSGWRALSTNHFPTAMKFINEQAGDILLSRPITYYIGSLAGSKNFQGNYASFDRYLNILQTKDTEWSGKVVDDAYSRLAGFTINSGSKGTLTLSGTATQSVPLAIDGGTVKVTGTWKGDTTVAGSLAFGGANGTKIDGAVTTSSGAVLDFTDFTVGEAGPISGTLTLDSNTTIRFPAGVEFPYAIASSIAGVSSLAAGKYTIGGVAGTVPLLFSEGKAYTTATGTFAGGEEPIAWSGINWGGVTPIYGSEVEVTVSASGTLTLGTLMDRVGAMKATFNVPAGMELTLTGMIETGEIWFKGAGTVVCNEATTLIGVVKGDSTVTVKYPKHTLPATTALWTDSDWKGTLVLEDCGRGQNTKYSGGDTHGVVRFDQYGSASSTIRAPGYIGISAVANQNTTCLATLFIDAGDVVEFNHGTGDSEINTHGAGFRFAKLTGTGKLRLDGTSDTAQYIFNDVDEFAGTVEITFPAEGGRKSFLFGAEDNWEVMNYAYAANLVILDNMRVAAGKTWDIPAGVIIGNGKTLTLSDGATVKALSQDTEGTIAVPAGTSGDPVSATLQGISNSVVNAKLSIGEYATLNIVDPSLTELTIPADSASGSYSNAGTLNLNDCTNLKKLYLDLGATSSASFDATKVTLPNTCGDIYFNIGNKRDLTGYALPDSFGSATNICYYAVETPEEYATGGFEVTNVTDGTVWLIRQNGALIKTKDEGDGRRTYAGGRSFAGAACWHEWDFEQSNDVDKLNDSGACTTNGTTVVSNKLSTVSGSITYRGISVVGQEPKKAIPSYVHPSPTDPLEFPAATTGWSAALRCSMPAETNTIAIAFGDKTSGVVGLATGASEGFVEMFNWTNGVYTTLAQLKVESPSDEENMHIYVFTVEEVDSKNYISLYRDGEFIHTAEFALESAITTFMVGEVSGRGSEEGLPAAVSEAKTGYVDYVRLYDKVLPEADITGLSRRRPFVSGIDAYERTVSLFQDWSAANAWTKIIKNNGGTGLASEPGDDANVTLTVDGPTDVSLNLDSNASYGTLIFGGSGEAGLYQTSNGWISAEMVVVRKGVDLTVDYDAVCLTNSVVGVDDGAILKFDFSDFPFENVSGETTITLAGFVPARLYDDTCTNRYGIVLPDTLPAHIASVADAWDGVSYNVTITIDHTPGANVYYKDGAFTEGMTVYIDPELSNPTRLLATDKVIVSDSSTSDSAFVDTSFNGQIHVTRTSSALSLTPKEEGVLNLCPITTADLLNCAVHFKAGNYGTMYLFSGAYVFEEDAVVSNIVSFTAITVLEGKTLTLLTIPAKNQFGGVKGAGSVRLPAATAEIAVNSFGNAESTVIFSTGTSATIPADSKSVLPALKPEGDVSVSFVAGEAYTFAKIVGDGNLTFTDDYAPESITITELANYEGILNNNSSKAVTVAKLTKTGGAYMGGAVLLTKAGQDTVDVTAVEIDGVEKYGFWDENYYRLAAAEYDNQKYATVADAIEAAGDANLFYITVFETSEKLSDRYMFIEEMGVMKVSLKPFAVVNGGTTTYHNDAQSAIIKVGMTPGYAYDYIEVLVGGNLDIPLNIFEELKIKNTGGATLNFTGIADDCTDSRDDTSGTYTVYSKSNKPTEYTWTGGAFDSITGDPDLRWDAKGNWSYVDNSSQTVTASRQPQSGDMVIFNANATVTVGNDVTVASITNSASVVFTNTSGTSTVTTGGFVLTQAGASISVTGVTLSPEPTVSNSRTLRLKQTTSDQTTTYMAVDKIGTIFSVY